MTIKIDNLKDLVKKGFGNIDQKKLSKIILDEDILAGEHLLQDKEGKLYIKDGFPHDPDKDTPCLSLKNDDMHIVSYMRHGAFHRTDGPAMTLVSEKGTKRNVRYFLNGLAHRTDGPAILVSETEEDMYLHQYYEYGIPHREDGPATVHVIGGMNSDTSYFVNGLPHNENGPAITTYDGFETRVSFYRHGILHREDGPASMEVDDEWYSSKYSYYKMGKLHRADGPAVIEIGDGVRKETCYIEGEKKSDFSRDLLKTQKRIKDREKIDKTNIKPT